MNEYNISQLPIIDDNKSIGSVRESKLPSIVLEDSESINTLISEIMDDPFPVIDENNTLDSASKTLKDSPAAIVRDRGTLVSVITRFDIIEFTSSLE
ncbi:MAG: CBS domain-containing protein [Bacteroidetes bacterium]|nr:CBS domain-containing protein [Bacteroidota bacterium]